MRQLVDDARNKNVTGFDERGCESVIAIIWGTSAFRMPRSDQRDVRPALFQARVRRGRLYLDMFVCWQSIDKDRTSALSKWQSSHFVWGFVKLRYCCSFRPFRPSYRVTYCVSLLPTSASSILAGSSNPRYSPPSSNFPVGSRPANFISPRLLQAITILNWNPGIFTLHIPTRFFSFVRL